MTAEIILLLAYVGLLVLLHVETIRHRKDWIAFLFGIPALLLWSFPAMGAPRVNPDGSIIYFTWHVIPTLGLVTISVVFWWKIKKNDHPVLSVFTIIFAAFILTLMIADIIDWAGGPMLRNRVFSL